MGTNFYVEVRGDRGQHIGKRSAAGLYCWDCGITLCQGGPNMVHHCAPSDPLLKDRQRCPTCHRALCYEWFDQCPVCGQKPRSEGIDDGAVGRELGFNHGPLQHRGVGSCSSFSWAVVPYELYQSLGQGNVIDEYGLIIPVAEFKAMLRDCPIQSFSSIGHEFS